MRLDASIANTVWLATSLPERYRFERAAAKVEATQRRHLARYLRRNAATEIGREYDFGSIRCWETYTERVPTQTYDDFHPWIERIAAGANNVLTAESVRLLEPTSGSSGAEKWVPYTPSLQAEFHRAVATWVSGLFLASPALMSGRAYWSVTPQALRESADRTSVPVGFDEDSAYLGGFAQRLLNLTMATSSDLKSIRDMDQFWRITLLQLLKARDLRLMSVWHPSYLSLLLQHLRRNWSELLDDLKKGATLSAPRLRVPANQARHRELARLGPDDPTAIWPELALISCWGDAHAAAGLPNVRAEFPGVQVQKKGLVATEAFVTLPLGNLRPLAIRSHFFEFRDDGGTIHPAWSLEQGDVYSLIVTTGGGLYRYELRDLVEVTGYYRGIPSLRFIGKADNVADHYGEKLNEAFVAACIRSACESAGITPAFAMLAFDETDRIPGYTLYMESTSTRAGEPGRDLDSLLRQNPHYELCIRLGQLRPVQLFEIASGAYETYSQAMVEQGMRLGDIKPVALSRFTRWSQLFRKSGED